MMPVMAKPTYIANVTLFDGKTIKKRQGVLFGTDGIEWIGAHSRAPKGAGDAREVDGAGKTLLPGLIDVHVHLQFDGSADFEKESKELTSAGFAAIKLIATGGVLTPGIPATFSAFTAEELEAGVREAHERDLPVAAHAIGANGIRAAVLAGVDSIEHCNQLTAATAREMVARGTFRSPTICAVRGILDHADRVPEYAVEKAREIEADSKKSHRTAIRAGVRPVCGTDAGTPFNPHGSAPREVVFMVEWGMSVLDALRAATANGAELLRLADVGTIEEGKRADLLLVDGDPVEDPPTLLGRRNVWRAGIPV